MQTMNDQRFSRLAKRLSVATCLLANIMVSGVAMAQQGGFQSNVTGGVVTHLATTSGANEFAFGGGFAGLPADMQGALQDLSTGAMGLSASDFAAADQCVTTNFPDSPMVRQYHQAMNKVTGDIAKLNKSGKGILPADGKVSRTAIYQTAKAMRSLRGDLMALLQATDALSGGASPPQMLCIKQTYDAIDKAVSSLEKMATALNQVMKPMGSTK